MLVGEGEDGICGLKVGFGHDQPDVGGVGGLFEFVEVVREQPASLRPRAAVDEVEGVGEEVDGRGVVGLVDQDVDKRGVQGGLTCALVAFEAGECLYGGSLGVGGEQRGEAVGDGMVGVDVGLPSVA